MLCNLILVCPLIVYVFMIHARVCGLCVYLLTACLLEVSWAENAALHAFSVLF